MKFENLWICKPAKSATETFTDYVPKPTLILYPEKRSDGTVDVIVKDINSVNDSLSSLNYDDFSLQKMLENGVSYKAIQVNPDLRIGFDDEINAFNDKLASMADKLFNQSNPIE